MTAVPQSRRCARLLAAVIVASTVLASPVVLVAPPVGASQPSAAQPRVAGGAPWDPTRPGVSYLATDLGAYGANVYGGSYPAPLRISHNGSYVLVPGKANDELYTVATGGTTDLPAGSGAAQIGRFLGYDVNNSGTVSGATTVPATDSPEICYNTQTGCVGPDWPGAICIYFGLICAAPNYPMQTAAVWGGGAVSVAGGTTASYLGCSMASDTPDNVNAGVADASGSPLTNLNDGGDAIGNQGFEANFAWTGSASMCGTLVNAATGLLGAGSFAVKSSDGGALSVSTSPPAYGQVDGINDSSVEAGHGFGGPGVDELSGGASSTILPDPYEVGTGDPSNFSEARVINEANHILVKDRTTGMASLYTGSGSLVPIGEVSPEAVNNSDVAVGTLGRSFNQGGPMIWSAATGVENLNALVSNNDAAGLVFQGLTNATDIADNGNIVALGTSGDGMLHSYLLTPQALLSGTVTDNNGFPKRGVTVQAVQGLDVRQAVTDQFGRYSLGVPAGTYILTVPGLPTGTQSDPLSATQGLLAGESVVQNFIVTPGPVVSNVQPLAGAAAGGDSVVISGAGFGNPGAADTVEFCPTTGAGSCQPGTNVAVVSDTSMTVTTPDMSSEQAPPIAPGQPPPLLLTDAVVTTPDGLSSSRQSNDYYYFGCEQATYVDGSYTVAGCFNQLDPTTDDTVQPVNVDGAQVSAPGTTPTDVDKGSRAAVVPPAPATLSLKVGGAGLAKLLTGLGTIDLSGPPFSAPAAPGVTLAGMQVTGLVTITPVTQFSMTGTASVVLPTIFGGQKASLSFTSTAGQGVTAMTITANQSQAPSIAKLFALSSLTLTWTGGGNWSVSGTGPTGGSSFSASGSIGFTGTTFTSGTLGLTGKLSLGGVLTVTNLSLTYSPAAAAWYAQAQVDQSPGTLSFTLPVDGRGSLTGGATVQTVGPVNFFGVINLTKFSMAYSSSGGGTWTASAEATAGSKKVALKISVAAGGVVSGFTGSLEGFTIFRVITLDKFQLAYTLDAQGKPDYQGSARVSFDIKSLAASFAASFHFDNGSFVSGSLDFNGAYVPVGAGVFLTGGGATITQVTPALGIAGRVNLVFGPQVKGVAAFGMVASLAYTAAAQPGQPPQISLKGTLGVGGVPGFGSVNDIGNAEITITGVSAATVCVGLGPPGPSGCVGSTGIKLFKGTLLEETLAGAAYGTISANQFLLVGTASGTGALTLPSATLSLNPYGVVATLGPPATPTLCFTYAFWTGQTTKTCPVPSGFAAPIITSAAATGGDPTTGLNVPAGTNATVSASGFVAGETVAVVLDSTGATLGEQPADASGDVTVIVPIPAAAALGRDGLDLVGQSSRASVDLPLMIASPLPAPPVTVDVLGPDAVGAGAPYSASALADGNPAPTYTLAPSPTPPSWLSIDPSTGAITGTEPNDGEASFSYAVVATNVYGITPGSPVTVTVTPPAPPTAVTVESPSAMTAGDSYVAVASSDGAPAPTYTLAPAPAPPSWLSVDPTTGVVVGTEPGGESSFSYSVVATNASGSLTSSTVTVQVTPPAAPTVVTVTGPSSLLAGAAYTASTTSDGGPAPTFAFAASPTPPVWLSIDPNSGAVSGTEPADGESSFSYAVTATNASGAVTGPTVTVGVTTPTAPTTVTVSGPSSMTAGTGYSATTTADGGPAPTFALATSPPAPTWLSVDPTTGAVSGIEPADGESSFSYAVVATNGAGSATSQTVTVEVTSPPVFTADSPPTSIDAGGQFTYQFHATGLPDGPTYALGPSAPAWLGIDETSGLVTGTEPADGETSFTFSVIATNAEGSIVDGPFIVASNLAPAFSAATPPLTVNAGAVYLYQFQASGSPDAPTYSLGPSSPSFLHIDPVTGSISSVEPGQASFSYSVIATNDEGSATAGPFTVVVSPWPQIASVTAPATRGNWLSASGGGQQIVISGGGFTGATEVDFRDGGCTLDFGSISASVPVVPADISADGRTITIPAPDESTNAANACGGVIPTDVQVKVLDAAGTIIVNPIDPLTFSGDQFEFRLPQVSFVYDPGTDNTAGPISGGDQLIIYGSGLAGATRVDFVDSACTGDAGVVSASVSSGLVVGGGGSSVTISSPGELSNWVNSCGAAGIVTDVRVTVADAATGATFESPVDPSSDHFAFELPSINSVGLASTGASSGPLGGGEPLVVGGSGFAAVTSVQIELGGVVEATLPVVPTSDSEIDFTAPNLSTLAAQLPAGQSSLAVAVVALMPDASVTTGPHTGFLVSPVGPPSAFTLTAGKSPQAITFTSTAPWGAIYHGPTYAVTATASSGLVPVTFSIDPSAKSVCSISGSTVSMTGVGTCVVDAKQAGNIGWLAATVGQQAFAVSMATPTVHWATPLPITYGRTLSTTQLNAISSVPGHFSYYPPTGTLLQAGSQTLTATFTPTDSAHYNPVVVGTTLTVRRAIPKITWHPLATYAATPLGAGQLDATTAIPGTFAYTPPAGSVFSAGKHTLSATFTPSDTVDYTSPTTRVSLTVSLIPTVTTMTFTTPVANGSEQVTNFSVTVTASFGHVATGNVTVKTGTKILCVAKLDVTGHGTCTLKASQLSAGSYLVSASYPGTVGTLSASKSIASSLVVSP